MECVLQEGDRAPGGPRGTHQRERSATEGSHYRELLYLMILRYSRDVRSFTEGV